MKFKVGDRVKHSVFGKGIITALGCSSNRAYICFDDKYGSISAPVPISDLRKLIKKNPKKTIWIARASYEFGYEFSKTSNMNFTIPVRFIDDGKEIKEFDMIEFREVRKKK